jgi:hypothetical protein
METVSIDSNVPRRHFCAGMIALPAVAQTAAAIPASTHWDAAGQTRRHQEIYALSQKAVGPLYDDRGGWIGRSTAPIGRERFWACFALLSGEQTREKGNAVIARTFADRATFEWAFSDFEMVAAVQLLIKNGRDLTPKNKDLLISLVREALARKRVIRFMGYNDNFPAMANAIASLGGELIDDATARQSGSEGMHRALDMLDRRGLLSEYTSSTYCPVTMLCYADIAEYAKDAEARSMALDIERRVWRDIASHFHGPTNILAGPHSRAYSVDSVGHFHQVHMMLYQAFGRKLWMNSPRFIFPPVEKQIIHHDGDVPFMQVSTVWISSGTYHPTAEIEHLTFEKRLPFRISGSSEYGCAPEPVFTRDIHGGKPTQKDEIFEYPSGQAITTSYLTEDYAVGSSTAAFLDGNQTDVFFVNFRRAAKPNSLADVSTIYSRYTVDDFGPGKPWTDPRNPGREVTTSLLGEAGRVRAVQKDGAVLAVYQSKNNFIGEYKGLRLTIVVPVIYRSIRRVLFEGQPVTLPFRSPKPGIVALEDDFLYCAFHPLSINPVGEDAVRIEENDGFLSIHFINYEGPARKFGRRELTKISNGFVAEVGGKTEYGSFAAFERIFLRGRVTDEVMDGQRVVTYERPGVRLALSQSILSGGLKYALVDGSVVPAAKLHFGPVVRP